MADPTTNGALNSDVHDALTAGVALAEPRSIGRPKDPDACMPFVVVPKGFEVKSLAHLFAKPQRRKGATVMLDEASFIRIVNEEKGNGVTRLFGRTVVPGFDAVFNDDSFGDHTAGYACPLSREWLTWNGNSKQAKTQVQFAEFVEANRLDITDPATADMMEIAQSIQASSSGNFKSKINRTSGGIEFSFNESTEAGAGADGRIKIPEKFTIAIPVFDQGEKWAIEAFLRYRIEGGHLKLWYELDRPQATLDLAVREVWERIEAQTELRILHGHATTARA